MNFANVSVFHLLHWLHSISFSFPYRYELFVCKDKENIR